MKHLPNAITASRGLAGLLVAWLLVSGANLAAFWVFVTAVSTDLVDGWLARKLNAQSSAGVWLDPLSDKVLVASSWVALLTIGWAPTWIAIPILVRDLIVVCTWLLARGVGYRFEPNLTGRVAISFEGVAIPLLLIHDEWMGVHWMSAGVILGIITLALSLASAAQYAIQGLRALR